MNNTILYCVQINVKVRKENFIQRTAMNYSSGMNVLHRRSDLNEEVPYGCLGHESSVSLTAVDCVQRWENESETEIKRKQRVTL